jgi:hypothetical protein
MGDPSIQRVKNLRRDLTDASQTNASEANQSAPEALPDQGIELLISDYRENFYIDDCH